MDTGNVSKPDTVPAPAPMATDTLCGTQSGVEGAASSAGGPAGLPGKPDNAAHAAGSAAPPTNTIPGGDAMETEPAAPGVPHPPSAATPSPQSPSCDAPALGTRIEVLWKISHGDGRVEERWWGGVVQDRLHTTVGSASDAHGDRSVHILLYDAYGEFEEDVSRVAFLPDGVLLDVSQIRDENKGLLDWRVEGVEQEAQMSLEEFAQANQEHLRAAGVPDDADLRFLSEMPAHVQMHMTSGYRVFADGVKAMLAELSQKHPEGYVVTERDIQEWCEKMKRFT